MNRRVLDLILVLLYVGVNFTYAQNASFTVKQVPSKYKQTKKSIKSSSTSGYVDMTNYLPSGFSKRGDVDYTKFIQKAIDENEKVMFPNFPLLINDSGLSIPSNRMLLFNENSLLKLKASNKERYEILRIHNVSNIKVFGAKIQGDRKAHIGRTGEWGMGIAIRGSAKNIEISDADISDCWGDGIYLGHLKHIAPENISINNPVINNCRRNGISITTGKNVLLRNALVSNTNGTKPECGIVIEPSASTAIFENVTIENAVTFNNKEAGLQIGGFEKLLGKSQSTSGISIINHLDDQSNRGIFVGRIRDDSKVKGGDLKGVLVIKNPNWVNNRLEPFVFRKQNRRGPKIVLEDVSAELRDNIVKASDIEL